MKNLFKKIALTLTLILGTISIPTFASTSTENSLENVIVAETENQTIIAQVPKKYVKEYKEKLKDSNFKQTQIDMMSSINNNTKALPDGKIIAQRYLYKSDIKRIYESVKPGAFENLILTFGPSTAVAKIIQTLGLSSPWGLVGALGTWAVEYIRVKPEDWWTKSYIMLL